MLAQIRKTLWRIVESFDQPSMRVPFFVAGA